MSAGMNACITWTFPYINIVSDVEGIIILAMAQSIYAFGLIFLLDFVTRPSDVDEELAEEEARMSVPGRQSAYEQDWWRSLRDKVRGMESSMTGRMGGLNKCPVAQKMIQQLIFSCGVLIGSGWERSFDVAIETVVKNVVPDERQIFLSVFVKVVISVMLTLIVLPAWRWYIVPTILELEEAEEEEEELEVERRASRVSEGGMGSRSLNPEAVRLNALDVGGESASLRKPLVSAA